MGGDNAVQDPWSHKHQTLNKSGTIRINSDSNKTVITICCYKPYVLSWRSQGNVNVFQPQRLKLWQAKPRLKGGLLYLFSAWSCTISIVFAGLTSRNLCCHFPCSIQHCHCSGANPGYALLSLTAPMPGPASGSVFLGLLYSFTPWVHSSHLSAPLGALA